MKKLSDYINERFKANETMKALLDKATSENRAFNDEEDKQYADAEKSFDEAHRNIERLEAAEKREKLLEEPIKKSGGVKTNEEKRAEELKKFSFLKIVRSQLQNAKPLDGLEKEMHEEAVIEAKAAQLPLALEGVGIPTMLLRHVFPTSEKRGLVAGTAATAGNLITEDQGALIEILRPRLQVAGLGARMMGNLQGDVPMPRHNGASSATWLSEIEASGETNPTTDKVTLTPKRLGAWAKYSLQLLLQSSTGVEALVRDDLMMAVRIALDKAAIAGLGTSNQPRGILETSGIGSVVGDTNGATPDWADIVGLETQVSAENADLGALAYLTTPGIRGLLKTTEKATNTAQFIWQEGSELNGYNAAVSTQVPSNLTKGTAENICHAIIFGNFNDLMIGQWGGMDVVVDPYSLKKTAEIEIAINTFWDIALRHPQSFAAMKDALLA